MIIIPAIDLKSGKCVRLRQGDMGAETVFSDDPVAMARRWAEEGAELIHIVDLDGAVRKKMCHRDLISRMKDAAGVPVQVGGGIRDLKAVEDLIQLGVARVVIGTEAIRNPDMVKEACARFPGAIVIGIDARGGKAAIEGWTETTGVSAIDLAREFENAGAAAINFTDILRDGMQTGPNIEETRKLAEAVSIPVVASGGVSSLKDIEALLAVASAGISGVITGKALYSGSLDLKEAIALAGKGA